MPNFGGKTGGGGKYFRGGAQRSGPRPRWDVGKDAVPLTQ